MLALIAALGVAAAVIWSGLFYQSGDNISDQEIKQLTAAFAGANLKPRPLDPESPETATLLAQTATLEKDAQTTLLADAKKDVVKLAEITLWDSFDEDGDVVEIATSGFSTSVQLSKLPVTLIIPYQPGAGITVTGLIDGGGGVTLGLSADGQQILVPPFSQGTTVIVPVN